jgi:hypothetical protein
VITTAHSTGRGGINMLRPIAVPITWHFKNIYKYKIFISGKETNKYKAKKKGGPQPCQLQQLRFHRGPIRPNKSMEDTPSDTFVLNLFLRTNKIKALRWECDIKVRVTMPRRVARVWRRTAMRFEARRTQSKRYSNVLPAAKSVAPIRLLYNLEI